MTHSEAPRVSIVIPALNEARRLPPSLEKIVRFLSRKNLFAEIIVVDNGSTDGTSDKVREFASLNNDIPIEVILETRRGKGAAVRAGMLHAAGDILFLCDADLSMPIDELERFVAKIESNVDIVIGCREGVGARRFGEPILRHCMGRLFNKLVRILTQIRIPDTQCGFKAFRRDIAHDLFSKQTIDGWGFDVEILSVARHRGYSLTSLPIDWIYDGDSRIRPVRDALAMLRDIWTIRNQLRQGDYDRTSTAPTETVDPIEKITFPSVQRSKNRAA